MNQKKKILIVDDELDVATYLEALFQDNGYDTMVAYDGAKAFDLARAEKPDLITLDITMPVQSGIRTYRNYKRDAALQKIPVLILTAIDESMSGFFEKLKGLPDPEGFLSKPVDSEELLRKVAELLSV